MQVHGNSHVRGGKTHKCKIKLIYICKEWGANLDMQRGESLGIHFQSNVSQQVRQYTLWLSSGWPFGFFVMFLWSHCHL